MTLTHQHRNQPSSQRLDLPISDANALATHSSLPQLPQDRLESLRLCRPLHPHHPTLPPLTKELLPRLQPRIFLTPINRSHRNNYQSFHELDLLRHIQQQFAAALATEMRAPLFHPMLSHDRHGLFALRDADRGVREGGVMRERRTGGVAAAGAVADVGGYGWGSNSECDGGAEAGSC